MLKFCPPQRLNRNYRFK